MKKIVSVLLAVLMLCSLTLVAFAATMRFSVIDNTYADASTTLIEADLGAQQKTSLKITAQVYKYSSVADDYMRSRLSLKKVHPTRGNWHCANITT